MVLEVIECELEDPVGGGVSTLAVPPGLDPEAEEIGGAYVTVSQQASEARPRPRDPQREQLVWNEKS